MKTSIFPLEIGMITGAQLADVWAAAVRSSQNDHDPLRTNRFDLMISQL
ncbi:MAG: hypothetical protein OSA84_08675 [Akkermansiaceae bacterium]|nr:hypothetical protein [Akkermansiaceae bacterium]